MERKLGENKTATVDLPLTSTAVDPSQLYCSLLDATSVAAFGQ